MKLYIYKGFDVDFLRGIDYQPLLETEINNKMNIFAFPDKITDLVLIALLTKTEEKYWMTYEEFYCVKDYIELRISQDPQSLEVIIIENNIYPNIYPIAEQYDDGFLKNLLDYEEQDSQFDEKQTKFLKYYSSIECIDGKYYLGYTNEERFLRDIYTVKDYYKDSLELDGFEKDVDYIVDISNDPNRYIEHINEIKVNHYSKIGVVENGNSFINKDLLNKMLKALHYFGVKKVSHYNENVTDHQGDNSEFIQIAKEDLKIPGFKNFRNVRFYKNPLVNNETIEISQATIIGDIVEQGKKAAAEEMYRDVFITASTGAGKSIIFQIPAIYMAKNYNRMTIVIEPIKELMVDQVENMKKRGYQNVAYINGDISADRKESIIENVKNGLIHILYLSPETLLSYALDSIIGDREIGLFIVDEAHIVTTWGVGFRPDYWYLGTYINRLRKETNGLGLRNKDKKVRKFSICTFTATAVVGGLEDTVSDTIISLYMNDPIKYIGDVRRDNIKFKINIDNEKYGKSVYETKKTEYLSNQINRWIQNNEKTVVYFPYNKTAMQAYNASSEFTPLKKYKKHVGIYTGQVDLDIKKNSILNYKNNDISIMYATKAFGMGIDIDDITNVYHYAISGTLSDYVQEIGRCARKQNSVGYAITDYLEKDMNYTNRLFGMSSIRHYQISMVLSILYDVYLAKNNRRLLVTPRMFETVFGRLKDDNDLEAKLKIILLMLEKDFFDKFQFKVLIARPRTMFSTAFMCVERDKMDIVSNSKYWKYFSFFEKGRDKEIEIYGGIETRVYDMGDIYKVDLEKMWEELYPNKSFAEFKYAFYTAENSDVFAEVKKYVHPRQMLTVNKKEIENFGELADKCKDEIRFICDKLNELKSSDYFSIEDFEVKLRERYGNTVKAKMISQSFINTIDPDRKSIKFRQTPSGETQYIISNGTYRSLAEKLLYKSEIYKKLLRCQKDEYKQFIDKDNLKVKSTLGTLKIMSLLNLITFEMLGGDNPEIYIYITDPEKIRKIVSKQIYYKNDYVDFAVEKHTRSVKILDYFFKGLNSDEERWNYIEDYFLGEDVLDKYKTAQSPAISHKRLVDCIDKDQTFETNQLEWDDIKDLIIDSYYPIINRLKNCGIDEPDFLNVKIKINSFTHCTPMMIWKDKDIIVFDDEVSNKVIEDCKLEGWKPYKMSSLNDINLEVLS